MELLLASTNRGKLREIRALLIGIEVQLITPDQLRLELDVKEDGQTYAENAAHKALTYAKITGKLTLADDSGLEVVALGGMPGLHSARFAPWPNATDADRRALLLEKLKGFPRPWAARFHCVIALATPAGQVQFAEGVCPGEIIPQERGANGFGYDPIFWLPEKKKTMAELAMADKNRLSHRARAVIASRPILMRLLTELRG
jgi:XTP/dITP diphosphohydrolase